MRFIAIFLAVFLTAVPSWSARQDADAVFLTRFSGLLRYQWTRDSAAYAKYRKDSADAMQRRDIPGFMRGAANWDSSLSDIQTKLKVMRASSANDRLNELLNQAVREFRDAVVIERRIAQSVLVMLANKIDVSAEMAASMKEVNLASVRSVLALNAAYKLLGMEPSQQ